MDRAEQARQRAREHHARNREARTARMRERYAENREAEIARSRAYAQTEAGKAAKKRWYAKNRPGPIAVARTQAYRQTPHGRAKTLLHAAKRNAKARAVPFALTILDIKPLLMAALEDGTVSLATNRHDTASLDRLIPELGYVPGNVQVIPWWLNAAYNRFPKDAVNDAILKMAERFSARPRL